VHSSLPWPDPFRFHHSYRQWMGMASKDTVDEAAERLVGPQGKKGHASIAAQGTLSLWFISSRKTSLRVFLGNGSKPRVRIDPCGNCPRCHALTPTQAGKACRPSLTGLSCHESMRHKCFILISTGRGSGS